MTPKSKANEDGSRKKPVGRTKESPLLSSIINRLSYVVKISTNLNPNKSNTIVIKQIIVIILNVVSTQSFRNCTRLNMYISPNR